MGILIGGKTPSTITIDGQLVYSTLTEPLNVTQNGTYTPTSPNIGFSEVEVNVGGQTEPDYFCITGADPNHDSYVSLYTPGTKHNTPVIYKSTDKQNWTLWDGSEITIPYNTSVYFYGNNPDGFMSVADNDCVSFSDTHGNNSYKSVLSGNIQTLLTREGTLQYVPNSGFAFLFNSNSQSGFDISDLRLPAISVMEYAYQNMFAGCTSLTTAPALPAKSISKHAYNRMFNGCTALTTAPALPATTITESCYSGMFQGCTSLTTAPALPATTLDTYCYSQMFRGCTSLTTAPALPATTFVSLRKTSAESCYSGMFQECTSLTTAPALPATTLSSSCYNNMFAYCTSLTIPPVELPATTLVNLSNCYTGMFQGCTSMTTAPILRFTYIGSSSSKNLSYMFYNCSQISEIKVYTTNWANNSAQNWVSGVAATGDFYNLGGATIPTGANGIPSGWTEHTSL